MTVAVKICGIKDAAALAAAAGAGARFAGFVFYPKSPRNIAPETAAPLVKSSPLQTVGLFVDPDDDTLRRVLHAVPLTMIQLHGNESPARVAAVKSMFPGPVMKAIRVATKDDLMVVDSYARVADWLLFDAKVDNAALPGGSGRAFDWAILKNFKTSRPWMLAGGLNAGNVARALSMAAPDAVDVSSGVESAPGVKDVAKIAAFVDVVRACKNSTP